MAFRKTGRPDIEGYGFRRRKKWGFISQGRGSRSISESSQKIESWKTEALSEAQDACAQMEEWARKGASRMFALLGEYGIGKTTALKHFTRELMRKRREGANSLPLPIYIDLRDYHGTEGRGSDDRYAARECD